MTHLLPPRYHFKVRRFHPLDRLAWWLIQRYLNRQRYTFRRMHTGKRPRFAASTPKANSTGWRVYLQEKPNVVLLDEAVRLGRHEAWKLRNPHRMTRVA